MQRWLIVGLSKDYFDSILESKGPEDYGDKYLSENQEFWTFVDELLQSSIKVHSLHSFYGVEKGGGGPDVPAMLLVFASGTLVPMVGSFVQYLITYLGRNDNREITIERGDTKLTLKGRSLPEEKELIEMLFPDLIEGRGANEE